MHRFLVIISFATISFVLSCSDSSESTSSSEMADVTYRVYWTRDDQVSYRLPIRYGTANNEQSTTITTPWERSARIESGALQQISLCLDSDDMIALADGMQFTYEIEVSTPDGSVYARSYYQNTLVVVGWTQGNPPLVMNGHTI